MDNPDAGLLGLLIAFFMAASYFLVQVGTSLLESSSGRLEKLADDGDEGAAAAMRLLDRPEVLLALVKLGLTFLNILAGAVAGLLASCLAGKWGLGEGNLLPLAVCVLGLTFLMAQLGLFLPQRTAMLAPEKILLRHHLLLRRLDALARPLVGALERSVAAVMLLLGLNPQFDDTVTEDEVKDLIEQGTEDGTFEKTEQDMVDRIFHMSDQTVYALMTPRTQMLWLDLGDELAQNVRLIRENPQTVFPVGRGSLDDFCGVLYAKDLLTALLAGEEIAIEPYIRKPMFVPRSMEALRALEQFRSSGLREAIVLDEYGGVIGFITLNDILLEIVGDMAGAHMDEEPQLTQRGEGSWYVDGLYSIDDFKEYFGLEELPGEEHDHFQTLGGFVTSYLGYIPKVAEKFAWNGLVFEIVDMDRARIDKVLVTRDTVAGEKE